MAVTQLPAERNLDGYGAPLIPWTRVRERLDRGLTQAPGTGGPDRHTAWLATVRPDGRPHVMPLGILWVDGAFYFIRWAASRYKIALATSATARNREATLSLLGIGELFHGVVDASGHQRPKPDPEVFLIALQRLGLRAADCWIIEDSVNGLRAAKAAGCFSAAITTTFNKDTLVTAGADIVVDSFSELRALLEIL